MCLPPRSLLGAALSLAVSPLAAQEVPAAILRFAESRADTVEIQTIVPTSTSPFIPFLTLADGVRAYLSADGVVEEAPGVLRVWLMFADDGRAVDAMRARLTCTGGLMLLPPSLFGEYAPEMGVPSALAAAACRVMDAVARRRTFDPGGAVLAARMAGDSTATSAQRWRKVVGNFELEMAPESRRTTPDGVEAWVRYRNRGGGTTVLLLQGQCAEERLRVEQGTATDSTDRERPVTWDRLYERVAPESFREHQLRAICGTVPLEPIPTRRAELPPPTLIPAARLAAPTHTMQTLLNAGPRGWLMRLVRAAGSPPR